MQYLSTAFGPWLLEGGYWMVGGGGGSGAGGGGGAAYRLFSSFQILKLQKQH